MSNAPPPKDRNVYGALVADGDADIFLTYCTNALQAARENATPQVVQLPQAVAVGADYGLTLVKGGRPEAGRLVEFAVSAANLPSLPLVRAQA